MELSRRAFLAAGTTAAALAAAPRAFAEWQPSQRYPDPSVRIVDQSFAGYRLGLAKIERLATGLRWCEGPVWFGDGRYLLWSDIPNNRIMRWDEETGAASVFRKPSNFANGNTRDRQGRLLTCEHGTRRVTRTEYDGSITVIADRFGGKPLNSPNDIVCKSDGSIWFTDPPFGVLGFYEGYVAKPELPTRSARALREPLLRRHASQPALHGREHVDLLARREHPGRARKLRPWKLAREHKEENTQ